MSKVVDVVVDTGGDIFGLGRSVFNKTVGALWDSLTPDLPEEDLATLAKGLQKGIDQPRRITFGRDRVGGVIAHQAEVERGEKKFVQMVVLINGAPIDALEEIYIADKPITDYPTESWDYELSDGRHTAANAKAVAKMAGWTNEHIGIDQAHIFIELENNREVFEDGISETEFLIRGARVWDPRDTTQNPDDETTWAWSQNAVLCALHYVRFYGAHEVPFDRLPLGWWIAAINVCDEDAEFKDAAGKLTTEKRYTTNGSFTFSSKPLDVLNQLEGCFAGKIFRQMGQWYVRVGAWYGNPTYTINADDVHGNIKIKWHADLRDRANVVRATFTDPEQNYDRTDAPPVVSAGYQAIDNQILEKSITLPLVRSGTTAQRLATIHLEQTRLGEIELPLKHKGLAAAVGRTVYLNLPNESINNKIYRVVERRFRLDGGVTLMCVEDGPDLWADNLVPGAQDLTPNSDYLVGKPQPIFDVRVTIDGDGNGIIKWNHPAPLAVNEYDVEFINTAADEQVFKTSVTYTQVTIPNLQLGEYTARISAKNIFGQRSLLVAVQFSVLTPTLPTVYVTADYNQITLTADIATAGIGTAFEWEFLGTTESPQSGERVLAQIYNRIGLKSETEYKFRVRSINHLGASAWVDVIASTTLVDLTEFINGVELTQLSPDAQTLIEDMNTQVDRLRPSTPGNIPSIIEQNIEEITGLKNAGFQTGQNVTTAIGQFNDTYQITATLQQYTENQVLEKATAADRFISGAEAYIKDQITVFNAGENSVDAQFSNVETKLDALNGSISQGITQVSGLEIDLKDANLNDIINAANELISNQKLAAQQVKIAIAREELKAVTSEQQALALKALELGVKIDDSLASAQQYTRTAVGYCVDVNGNISSENDAVKCVAASGSWVAGPLAEFIENLQISDGDKTASIKQLRQVFKTVDGNLVARGGWQLDNNGRAVGVVGYNDGVVGNLDLVGDVIRQGAMVGNVFVPTSYVDNTDPVNPQHVVRGRMELGDGYVVASADDIKSQGKRGSVTVDVATSTGVWYNSTANSAVPDGVPVIHDRVTIYKSTNPAVQTTKRFNGSVWETYTLQVHGSAIIQDTLDANVIRAGSTMTAPKIVGAVINGGTMNIKSSDTGARTEITEALTSVYNSSGQLIVRIGVW